MKKRLEHQDLRGIFPATPTPVNAEGQVDPLALKAHVAHLVAQGVNGLVPLGGTGEYGALGREERVRAAALTAETAAGAVPVVAGVLDPGLPDALSAGKTFADVGVDALMVVTPYYTVPSQEGIYEYFVRFADASPLPVLIYEIPYRTKVAIDPQILHRLSRHENIIGMKACNTDMYHFLQVVSGVSEDFSVLSGEDTLFPLHRVAGAKGGVVVTASVLPRHWRRIHALCEQGEFTAAIAAHRELMPLLNLMFAETNPGPLKSAWDLVGVQAPYVLPPLAQCSPALRDALRTELEARLQQEQGMA